MILPINIIFLYIYARRDEDATRVGTGMSKATDTDIIIEANSPSYIMRASCVIWWK